MQGQKLWGENEWGIFHEVLSELGSQLDQKYKSRHAGLILFGFAAAAHTQFDPLSKLAESKLIGVDYMVYWKWEKTNQGLLPPFSNCSSGRL